MCKREKERQTDGQTDGQTDKDRARDRETERDSLQEIRTGLVPGMSLENEGSDGGGMT